MEKPGLIKVLIGCGASGKSLVAGHTYAVPDEVSVRDADILIRMGKAEACAKKETRKAAAKNGDEASGA